MIYSSNYSVFQDNYNGERLFFLFFPLDLTASHYTEDMRQGDLPTALDEDMMTLHEPVIVPHYNSNHSLL